MTTKKRLPVDTWYFDEVVRPGFGFRCCACGRHEDEVGKMQRGHIVADAVGGGVEPENLITVCLPCNKKYAKSDTPFRYFPEDWRERLAGLVLLRLNPKYHVSRVDGHTNVILTSKPTENTRLVDLKGSDFGLPTGVYSCSHQRDLTPHEKQATIRELVARARQVDPPPSKPSEKRWKEMYALLKDHGRDTFLNVGAYYLQKQPWITPDDHFVKDSWGEFTEGFEFWLDELAAKEDAERKRRERDEAARQAVPPPADIRPAPVKATVDDMSKKCLELMDYIAANLDAVRWNTTDKAKIAETLPAMRARINDGVATKSDLVRFRDWLNAKKRAVADALQSA